MADLTADYAEAHDDVKRDEISIVCRFHGFRSYGRPRKVYDLVAITSNLDWLEIRLHTLAAHVDYFVIAESSTASNSSSQALTLSKNWDRFKDFHEKIIYRSIEMPVDASVLVAQTDRLRDAALTEVLESAVGSEQEAKKGDVLIVGDVNELPRPGTLSILRHCDFPSRTTLASQSFIYSFSRHRVGSPWPHPQATTHGSNPEDTILPTDLRKGFLPWSLRVQDVLYLPYQAARRWWDRAVVLDAGWHCRFCYASLTELRKELRDLGDSKENIDDGRLVQYVYDGRNVLDETELYKPVRMMRLDMPKYLQEQWEEYGRLEYLVHRGGSKAGFEDSAELLDIG